MMIPLVNLLKKSFPHAQITWVIEERFFPIVERMEGIEFIKVRKIKNLSDMIKMWVHFKNRTFDLLLATQASFSAHLFYLMIKAKRKIGFDRARSKDLHTLFINERIPYYEEHTVDAFLRFAKHLGAKEDQIEGRIPLVPEDYFQVDALMQGKPYYVINPFSTRKERDWTVQRYIEIGREIFKKTGIPLILTGSKADEGECEYIKQNIPGEVLNLAGKTSIRELAAWMDQALFLISPDSGPVHIASHMQTPVIGLYAASLARQTGPYFIREYTIDKYEDALKAFSGKKKKNFGDRIYVKGVMQLIEVQEVLEKVSLIV